MSDTLRRVESSSEGLQLAQMRHAAMSLRCPLLGLRRSCQPVLPRSITCQCANASKTSIQFSFGGPLIPCDGHMEEHIVAAARSFARGTHFRYGGLHASHRDHRASLLHILDPAVAVGRAPGSARGSRRRVGAINIQQRMPNLPHDQRRRQSPGSKLTQHHRKESRLVADLRLFQCYEGRGFRVGTRRSSTASSRNPMRLCPATT